MSAIDLDNPSKVLLAHALTKKYKGKGVTADYLAKEIGWTISHTRRVLKELRDLGVTDYVQAAFLTEKTELLGDSTDSRTKVHYAVVSFEDLMKRSEYFRKTEESLQHLGIINNGKSKQLNETLAEI
jgi:methylphosphotriester-DNA--protein-cysteine methyltransferase